MSSSPAGESDSKSTNAGESSTNSVPLPTKAEAGASKFTPSERIFRFLFVSPAYFTAAFEQKDFGLTVVFRSFDRKGGDRMVLQGPHARSTFMLSFEVPERKKGVGVVIPQYNHVGEEVSALLGAFFGKFVVNAGHIQSGPRLTIPNMWDGPCHSHASAPFNSQPRQPGGPDLELTNAEQLLKAYFYNHQEEEVLSRVLRAAEFYRMALENFHERPEMAFALLLSALEALIDLQTYTDEEKYDPVLQRYLVAIAAECKEGEKIVANLKNRLFQIRRKVAKVVDTLVPDAFFQQREAREAFVTIKDREELKIRVLAAYDLRSKLLHTGNRTGINHLTHTAMGEEVVLGRPVLADQNLVNLLCRCPTLVGLERITSTVLREAIRIHLLASPA